MPPKARVRARKGARQVKVVVTGPYGAGKTTLIKTISEITVLSTERKVSDHAATLKSNTTVAMDFGRLTIDHDLVLFLFGTPGQKRFDFMWDILSDGMLGFLVVVDAARPDSFDDAEGILSFFEDAADVPFVVAVNKTGDDPDADIARARDLLRLPDQVRVVSVDARDRESVKAALIELLYAVLDDVQAKDTAAV